jgi:hypothetical protein
MSYGCDCGGEILFDSDKRNEPKHLPQKRLEHERTVAHKDGLKKVRDPCSYSYSDSYSDSDSYSYSYSD